MERHLWGVCKEVWVCGMVGEGARAPHVRTDHHRRVAPISLLFSQETRKVAILDFTRETWRPAPPDLSPAGTIQGRTLRTDGGSGGTRWLRHCPVNWNDYSQVTPSGNRSGGTLTWKQTKKAVSLLRLPNSVPPWPSTLIFDLYPQFFLQYIRRQQNFISFVDIFCLGFKDAHKTDNMTPAGMCKYDRPRGCLGPHMLATLVAVVRGCIQMTWYHKMNSINQYKERHIYRQKCTQTYMYSMIVRHDKRNKKSTTTEEFYLNF